MDEARSGLAQQRFISTKTLMQLNLLVITGCLFGWPLLAKPKKAATVGDNFLEDSVSKISPIAPKAWP